MKARKTLARKPYIYIIPQNSLKSKRVISRGVSSAFTIVELLIVVVVIAILAAITVVSYNGITRQANDAALSSSLQQAGKKVASQYLLASGVYPASLSAIGLTNSSDTTYEYTVNTASPIPNYCITITKDSGSSTRIGHIAGAQGGINLTVPDVPCNAHQTAETRAITAAKITAASLDCPTNYIAVPGNSLFNQKSFCVMKYEAKNNGSNVAVSQAADAPWTSISQVDAKTIAASACTDCHLITNSEWLTIAHNALTQSNNWVSGTVGSGTMFRGHTDGTPNNSLAAPASDSDGYNGTGQTTGEQKRTLVLSNGAVIWDLSGNVYEWTQATTEGVGKQPGLTTDTAFVWKQWNNENLIHGGFVTSVPAYGTAEAANWNSAHGIGQVYSDAGDGDLRAVRRSGSWNQSVAVGSLAAILSSSPATAAGANTSFRVAR